VQDLVQVKVIEEVTKRVLSGEPLRSIAHDLTGRKVLTPKDPSHRLKVERSKATSGTQAG
jgi:hypothetical protein